MIIKYGGKEGFGVLYRDKIIVDVQINQGLGWRYMGWGEGEKGGSGRVLC